MEKNLEKYLSIYSTEIKDISSNISNESTNPTSTIILKSNQDEPMCKTNTATSDLIKHLRNETIKLFFKTFRTKSKWIRFYLGALLFCCTGITAFMIIGLVISYLEYEVLTTSQTIDETPALFPKVTICNYVNFQTEYAVKFLRQVNREVNESVNLFDVSNDHLLNLTYDELNELASQVFILAMKKINSNFSDEQKRKLEHEPNDLLHDCQFGNKKCSINDEFIWTYDKSFGNCYVFNSKKPDIDQKKSEIAGNNFGLNIKFYVNFHENLTLFHSLTSSKGVILLVENNSMLIDRSLNDGHLRIPPGYVTSVKVDRTFKFEMTKPYSTCDIPNGQASEYYYQTAPLYALFFFSAYQYSQQSCLLQCFQGKLLQTCSCTDQNYLSLYNNSHDCITENEMNCTEKIWSTFNWSQCLSDCPLECNQTIYGLTTSSVKIIGDKYVYLIKENMNLSSDFVYNPIDAETAASSFVELSVFYETLSYTYTSETPKIDLIALIASLGGDLSLFLGVSIFSLFELIEIFIEIYMIRREERRKSEGGEEKSVDGLVKRKLSRRNALTS